MKHLTPAQRQEVWQTGVVKSSGKVPTARTIKGIVERIEQRDSTPPPIPYSKEDVVKIRAGSNSTLRKHDGCWGRSRSLETLVRQTCFSPDELWFLEKVEERYE